MKDFIEKPIDTKVRETALRIMERALFYNSTRTQREYTNSKPTFFVWFSGHIGNLEVYIYENGWKLGDESEYFTVYLSERGYNGTSDKIQNELVLVLKRMDEIYKNWYEKEYPNE